MHGGAPVRGREFDLGALSSTGYRAPGPAASPWQASQSGRPHSVEIRSARGGDAS